MNNTFDWTRFGKVVRKDFQSIWQNAGTTLLIITLLPILAWLLWWVVSGFGDMEPIAPEVRWSFIFGSVMLAAMVTPSRMYRTCNIQKEGIYFAMLPASKLEKYLSMMLFSIVVCPLLCFLGGIVLDYLLALLPFGPYRRWLWQTDHLADLLDGYRATVDGRFPNVSEESVLLFRDVLTPWRVVWTCLLTYLSTVALFLFTTTIFKKHKVLQTLLWTWLISFVLQIVAAPIILGAAMSDSGWWMRLVETSDPLKMVNVVLWVNNTLYAVFAVGLFCWAGYRLKQMKY